MTVRSSLRAYYKGSPRLRWLSRRLKNAATYWLTRSALAAVRLLPLRLALRLAEHVGTLVFRLMPSLRQLPQEHLTIAFGAALSEAERTRIARQSVINIAKCLCEVAKFDEIAAHMDDHVEIEGAAVVEAIVREGRGAIAVTGHLGNWELLAAYFGRRGIPVAAVARRFYDERINSLIVDFRSRNGVQSILREDRSSARELLRTLKRHGWLAMVIDQDTHAPSVSVPFFGRLARTPIAPATLALRRDIPLVAAFIERRPGGGHRITVHPPFALPRTGNRLEDTRSLVAAMSALLEAEVRRRPEEWVWWHKRWDRPPVPQLDIDGKFQYGLAGKVPGAQPAQSG